MARAQGAFAQLLLKDESVYGTAPTGNYNKLPFKEIDFGAAQKLVDDDTIGHGREEIDPAQDVIDVKHSGIVPLDVNNIGFWLKLMFGAATDSGSNPNYIHTFTSGGSSLPSAALEVGMVDLSEYWLKTGAMLDTMEFDLAPSGLADVSIDLVAQNDVRSGTSGGGTPTSQAWQRFSQFEGSISLGGSNLVGITAGKAKLANNLDAARTINGAAPGLIEGIDPGQFKASLSLDAFLEAATFTALFGNAESFTPVAIALAWTIDTNHSLTLTFPRVFLPRPTTKLQGPGGIKASFDAVAVHDPSDGYVCQAVLKNAVVTY